MTKINLHQMFEKLAEAGAHDIGIKEAIPVIRSMYPSRSRGEMARVFGECYKAGYTAALNDLQGKVDGLLNALQKYIDESKHWPLSDDKYDKGERYSDIAIKALAEFHAQADSTNVENPQYTNLYPKYNCPTCGDWFHMPYKYCKCEQIP